MLGRESMIAMHLFRLGPTRHVLHVVCSHLVFDGWASTVVVDELAALYRARRDGRAAGLPPADHPGPFAADEQVRMAGPQGQASANYWRTVLASPPMPPQLGDREPQGRRSFAADTAVLHVDGARTQRLHALARERRMTLFQVLLGAVAKLVIGELQQDEVVLGIPYASQGLGKHAALVADGVLDLPLRLRLDRNAGVIDCAAEARGALMDALEHPLVTQGLAARLVGAPSRGERPPLTGVFFNLNPWVALDGFAPLRAKVYEGRKPGLLGELIFNFYEDDDGLLLDLHHSTEFFSQARITALLERLDALLDAAVTKAPAPTTPRVEALIAAQAARTPERIALSSGDERWTYAELDARANRIAHALAARGVRRGDWVGLCLPRSPDLVAALLGVLKCGAAYVPLDPAFPLPRLRDMAEDAGIALLLSDAENVERLAIAGLPALRLDADDAEIARAPTSPPAPIHGADAPAYVIYTSGSTGKPKGVVVLHGGVVNFLQSMAHTPGLGPDERLLAVTTLSFDIAVLELLLPLTVGAQVVLAQRTDAIDGEALKQLIASRDVSLMQATPSTWHLLLEAGFRAPHGFRALCGGEALSPALAKRLLDAGVDALWNMYGPTETTVWSTVARVIDPDAISVGRPIDATVVRVLDEQNRECAVGEAGEICIGGAGVAQGYHARPELTAERFIADPFDARPGARLYRTGDLGAWNTDGTIKHMGRLDHQVKLRGYRIELGEIEAALERLPSVGRAAMRVENFGPMDDRLVAYVVAAPGASLPHLAALRRELGQWLPDYMLPQVIKPLDVMPLLPNGKIDRKALGAPALGTAQVDARRQPSTTGASPEASAGDGAGLAAEIGRLMGGLLQREPLGPDEHFFELGGHSLLAAELATAVQQRRGARPTLRTLFEAPTPARLAEALLAAPLPAGHAGASDATRGVPTLAPRGHDGPAPLSVQQLRAWFVEQTSSSGSVNLLPSAHRLLGPFDAARFQRVLDAIVARQSALRTVFRPSADGVEQLVMAPTRVNCPFIDLSTRPHADAEADIVAAIEAMQADSIDLAAGPPFRCALFRLGAEEHVFGFVVHHLVWDGWSFDLFYREFAAHYAAESGTGPAPAPLAIEYLDFCEWQQALLASGHLAPQIEQWRTRLLPLPLPLALPTDKPRPLHFSGRGASVHRHVEVPQLEALHALARRHRTTLFVVLLAVHAAALRRWSGQTDVVVGTPVRGRDAGDLLEVMGFFVNALPLRFTEPAATIEEWITQVGQVATEGFGAPDVPIEALVRELHVPRDPSRPVLFQSMFSYQDTRGRPESWSELRHERFAVPITGASHELSLWCVETSKGLELVFTYSTDLFQADRVTAWVGEFEAALVKLVDASAASPVAVLWSDTHPMESLLVGVWRELLGADDIGPDDNFFDRGGHSLLALTMVSRVELASGKRLPLLRVGDSSLRTLAAMLREDSAPASPAASASPGAKSLGGWLRRLVGQPEA
ncbi:MAG: amino acid adenylation domain-containing protein [Silanimonas sp.]